MDKKKKILAITLSVAVLSGVAMVFSGSNVTGGLMSAVIGSGKGGGPIRNV